MSLAADQSTIPKTPPGTLHLLPSENPWPAPASVSLPPVVILSLNSITKCQRLRISVLDSSFNPPTKAHLALASLPPPPSSSPKGEADEYTSSLLLFSITNVEKKLKPTDPSPEQRIHLISLLLPHLPPNTAIGLINEPTFVGKSRVIHEYIATHHLAPSHENVPSTAHQSKPELTFIIGTDTLTRFFDPRYYTSTEGGMDRAFSRFFQDEGSVLVSARRGGEAEREVERRVLERPEVERWAKQGKVVLMGTGGEDWVGMSSTKVREAVKADDWKEVERLVVPEIAAYIKEQQLYKA